MIRWGILLFLAVVVTVWLKARPKVEMVAIEHSVEHSNDSKVDRPKERENEKLAQVSLGLPKPREPLPNIIEHPQVDNNAPIPTPYLDWRALPLISSPSASDPWPGWLCADIDDASHRSLWVREGAPEASGEIHDGTCAEWANRGPDGPDWQYEYEPAPLEFLPPAPEPQI